MAVSVALLAVPTWPFVSEEVAIANGLEVEMVPDEPPHPASAPRAESSPIANDI